ncbi:hypothetical protein CPB84DRAFT_1751786 [Gymnopilus junonius]|uniref:Uncharacterized protein n=1 Tax=Gymnopilus junonius TaxID=109634 RepID=A0A9P5TGN9_GYMJU|nr:hypothetical protein CPB84DRAFT_1751786 [Gymnopilus junonius]
MEKSLRIQESEKTLDKIAGTIWYQHVLVFESETKRQYYIVTSRHVVSRTWARPSIGSHVKDQSIQQVGQFLASRWFGYGVKLRARTVDLEEEERWSAEPTGANNIMSSDSSGHWTSSGLQEQLCRLYQHVGEREYYTGDGGKLKEATDHVQHDISWRESSLRLPLIMSSLQCTFETLQTNRPFFLPPEMVYGPKGHGLNLSTVGRDMRLDGGAVDEAVFKVGTIQCTPNVIWYRPSTGGQSKCT